MGAENRDQIIRDLDSLALEKYIEEIVSASAEGCLRCKSDKDAWAAVEVWRAPLNFPDTLGDHLFSGHLKSPSAIP